jgi:hypothetical protein
VLTNTGKLVAVVVLVIGIVSLALGGYFVSLGFDKSNYLTQKMVEQEITYGGAGSTIEGIIDNSQEAQEMASILEEHSKAIGNYSKLAKEDPARQQILNALTMQNSLQMAVMGFGLTDIVKATGAFMALTGLAFIGLSATVLVRRKNKLQ